MKAKKKASTKDWERLNRRVSPLFELQIARQVAFKLLLSVAALTLAINAKFDKQMESLRRIPKSRRTRK
jgi:hypothetical protein